MFRPLIGVLCSAEHLANDRWPARRLPLRLRLGRSPGTRRPFLFLCQQAWLPALGLGFFEGYFEGKKLAEAAAADAVGGDATKWTVIKPTFIYGGEEFVIPLPGRAALPRVSRAYGMLVEEALTLRRDDGKTVLYATVVEDIQVFLQDHGAEATLDEVRRGVGVDLLQDARVRHAVQLHDG